MKLNLPDVTLVMMDGQCPELAQLAVEDCLQQATFGEALIFSPNRIDVAGARWIAVEPWRSVAEVCRWEWLELHRHLKTRCFMFCQWDAWIIDAGCWSDEFLRYDFIGAPWWYDDGLNVGNGCGMRSTALMRYLAEHQDQFPVPDNEDTVLCRRYRLKLQQRGFKWAPEDVASRFAFECTRPSADSKHFMFHDMFNFPAVLSGERLAERLRLCYANPYIRAGHKIPELESGRKALILPRLDPSIGSTRLMAEFASA